MVALPSDNSIAADLLVEFNKSLAAAKVEALSLLRSFIAGEMPSRGKAADRERRLAASQVLRTPFMKDPSSEASPKPRSESRLRDSDAERPDRYSDGQDAERSIGVSPKPRTESRLRESHAARADSPRATDSGPRNRCALAVTPESSTGARQTPDMGLEDTTHGTPIQVPSSPPIPDSSVPYATCVFNPSVCVSDPQDPSPKPHDCSVSSVGSVVKSDPVRSGFSDRLARIEAMRADLSRAARGLRGADEKRVVKQALAALGAASRAPT